MYLLNKSILLIAFLLGFIGCQQDKDRINDLSTGCNIPCSGELNCTEGKCSCPEGYYTDYKTPFTSEYDPHECRPLNDSIYVRVGHDGNINIESFEMYDLLFVPQDHKSFGGLLGSSGSDYDKAFPEQFLVRLFSSDYHEQADFYAYYPIVFENAQPDNAELPMQGETSIDIVMDAEGFSEGLWHLDMSEEEATLQFDLYRPDSTGFHVKIDELIMYYERYEK